VVVQPAFAYGVAVLLGLQVIAQSFLLPSGTEPVEVWRGADGGEKPLAPTTVVPAQLTPSEAAVALLEAYMAAYDARDLAALSRVWNLNEKERTTAAQLFAESRRLSLLAQVQSVQEHTQEDQAAMTFSQVTTVLSADGRFYTKGPEVYVAEFRRQGDQWKINEVRKVAD
jgi:hypothetical protein